jgi:RHS repeat-associated protein
MALPESATSAPDGARKPATPSISLPTGGGAIRGIGEKFAANPVTGTGSMSIPLTVSSGRSDFGPELTLSYDSGSGNGPFGFGWGLSLPAISRKTDKGLPRYDDTADSDLFILSGAEDLVPVMVRQGAHWVPELVPDRVVGTVTYRIRRYRPRVEGLFARIERWTNADDPRDVHWHSISVDNVLTLYGKDAASRIVDAEDPGRIFTWLLCEIRDDRGNAVLYEYKPEDGAGADLTQAHERNRGDREDPRRQTNRYLKRIRYGNRVPLLDGTGHRPAFLSADQVLTSGWMFEVVFDYGEHDPVTPHPQDGGDWLYREDAFSTYRSGFEVRTARLCRRVLMFHHFPGEPGVGDNCLVRSTDFTYSHEQDPSHARNPVHTFLLAVTQSGYRRDNGGYLKRSFPPVEFEYGEPVVQDVVKEVAPESLKHLPIGLDGVTYQWTDLHGEGIPGILTEQAGAWFYARNLSPINTMSGGGTARTEPKFAPMEVVATKPNLALSGDAQFMDLAGDGQPDLVVLEGPTPGFYEHDGAEGWSPFRPFTARLNRDIRDPNLRFVDLTGDGHADVLITEEDAFVWHESLAEDGFGPARRVAQVLDEERGPRLVFADGLQSIYLADLSGDGLTDLARVRNGEVCYWPNLGYARFGAKVTMDHAPSFDHPDQFDQRRLRLADIDGSGTTDIIYLHGDGVRLYFNQSGNSWSEPQVLRIFPRVDDVVSIMPIDLLGNGTACLVWSSPLPGDARRQMRYVDLMGGQKPHLLIKTVNNFGAEIRVQYAPSTKFYLQDRLDGKPWITRLPFPVHLVERVETYDHISRNRFVTRYAYHHGYFDGEEREFHGFGMVEQWDTEEFAALTESGAFPTGDNVDATSHVPPVRTKTWFHTGVYLDRDHVSRHFEGEYYREPDLTDEAFRAQLLPDTTLPTGLTLDEEREACRALNGMMLRQEIYADDAGPEGSEAVRQRAATPYTVVEQDFTIRPLQPRAGNRHAVFFTHPREVMTYNYERNPADPRIQHALTLEVDGFGNVLKEADVGYGRRRPDLSLALEDQARQAQTLVTYTEYRVTNAIDTADDYRTPLACETRTYELTGYTPGGAAGRFRSEDLVQPDLGAADRLVHIFDDEIPYEATAGAGRLRRLVEHVRALYRPNDAGAAHDDPLRLLPLGTMESLALPGDSYRLAFTPGLLDHVFRRPLDAIQPLGSPAPEELLSNPTSVLPVGAAGEVRDRGGYVDLDGNGHWWIPAGRVFFSSESTATAAQEIAFARHHFFLPHRYRDPFHTDAVSTETVLRYDGYDLLLLDVRDALGNRVTAGERSPSGEISPGRPGNDYRVLQPRLVMDPNRNRSEIAFDALGMVAGIAVMGKPEAAQGDSLDGFDADLPEAQILGHLADPLATPHSILGRATNRVIYELFAYLRTRDDAEPQPALVYKLEREVHDADLVAGQQTKVQHHFSYSDGFGREIQQKVQAEPGNPDGVPDPSRWVSSGWLVFNNKGKPIRQYEPFFSATHRFEFDVRAGVSPVLFYDPIERVVATLNPNHTWEKAVFDPWRQETWDGTDTLLVAAPQADPDVGEFFRRLPEVTYLPTWHALRTDAAHAPALAASYPDLADRVSETRAAEKAAVHANTPLLSHSDTLGRTFLTVGHNRFRPGTAPAGAAPTDEFYETHIIYDIEGNVSAVTDPKARVVMRYHYDLRGNRVHQASMDAGERWMLRDVMDNPIRMWDSRGFLRRVTYDELRRPVGVFVTGNGVVERLVERTVYGEGQGDATNHRTHVHQVFDDAGVFTHEAYDFKGNLQSSRRELLSTYKQAVDWLQNPALDGNSFATATSYDALDRPVTATLPDGSTYRPAFNEANLLVQVDVNLRGELDGAHNRIWTPFVTHITYNVKGQRERVDYENGVRTTYSYDPLTFRLVHLRTTRPSGPSGVASQIFASSTVLQDLRYTYDPVGNITRIEDRALRTLSHNNEHIEPVSSYTYDAVYRLIEAKGREHIGQTTFDFTPAGGNRRDYPFVGHRAHPNDLQAMRNYTERYEYDEVGNFRFMRHSASGGSRTRAYDYEEDSLIESTQHSNRLTRATLGNGTNFPETYTYVDGQGIDVHGCMTAINSMKLVWDVSDRLQQVDLPGGGTAYYIYDAGGERVRKVIESPSGARLQERLYLGGFEIYREYANDDTVELERELLHVLDDSQRIASVETQTFEGGLPVPSAQHVQRYELGNHIGSASLELDETGALISYEETHPYGTTSFQAGRSAAEVSRKRYRYSGQERDEESGLYYHGARYYAPWVGRWTSYDPKIIRTEPEADLDIAAELHQFAYFACYVYAFDSPLMFIDPTGEENIVVVGSQHDSSAGNKLMFVHQGLRKLREYEQQESEESRAFVLFQEGYTPDQIEAVRTEVDRLGGQFILVDSVDDLINYVNTQAHMETLMDPRSRRSVDPVSNLDMFAHGVVGSIEFGYQTSKSNAYRLDASAAARLDRDAFGPDTNARPNAIASYACRTGLGNPSYNAVGGPDVRTEQSLAQRLADVTQVEVRAFITRSDYSATLGTRADRRHSCRVWCNASDYSPALKSSMARRRNIDGATFDPHGAMHPVQVSSNPTPAGLPTPHIRTYSPRAQPTP